MNSSDTERERFVMPQWLPFNAAVKQGELFAPEAVEVIDTRASEMAFAEAMGAFTTEPGPFLAADLLGIAVRLGRVGEARTLAEYLLAHDVVGPATNDLARRVLGRKPAGQGAGAGPAATYPRGARLAAPVSERRHRVGRTGAALHHHWTEETGGACDRARGQARAA